MTFFNGSMGYQYSDLLNQGSGIYDNATFLSLTAGNIIDTGLIPSKWVGTDANQQLESRSLQGTTNQINLTNIEI